MAATTTGAFSIAASNFATRSVNRRRHVNRRAARALKTLGHAIEYLADEFLHDSVPPSGQKDRLQALQLLRTLNREIYNECPVAESFADHCRWFLRLQRS